MHLFLWAEDSEAELSSELSELGSLRPSEALPDSLLAAEFPVPAGQRVPHLVFARQWLPEARAVHEESINAWARDLFQAVAGVLADDHPWSLHIEPHYGAPVTRRMGARAWHSLSRAQGTSLGFKGMTTRTPGFAGGPPPERSARPSVEAEAGRNRCTLIRGCLIDMLQRKRRHLLRQLRKEPQPFSPGDSLVQLILTSPDSGFISIARAPLPFEQRHLLSPFPKGQVAVASDKAAPSRAFAKLVEAERRLGRPIQHGETCVDLGAAPGSWTYVAVGRGARVIAVDRSPLRKDLALSPQVDFQPGDAFRFQPPRQVDWLLCDVIAEPERTAALLLEWLRHGWCRHFVVTLKLRDAGSAEVLQLLKRELPPLTREVLLTRLCANKKEVCAFGLAR